MVELKDIKCPEKHEPCALSSVKLKRFKKIMTITSMFLKKRKSENSNTDSKNTKPKVE